MDATAVGTIFTTFVGDIGSILTSNLPLVLGVLAALIGLGFLITRVKKWIGKKA
jgi:uncharacterized membrane protein YdjX (TVP38/TMEM64 family)